MLLYNVSLDMRILDLACVIRKQYCELLSVSIHQNFELTGHLKTLHLYMYMRVQPM